MPKRKFSRLTNDQKQALRGELDAKIPVTDLAKKYGVSRRTIYNLKNRWEERLPQSRSKVLTVRVSAEDMERLDALAKKLDLSRADTARRVLLYAAGVYHIEPPEAGEIAGVPSTRLGALGPVSRPLSSPAGEGTATGVGIGTHCARLRRAVPGPPH